jgi:hypothetical protein
VKIIYPPELQVGDHILYGHYEAEVIEIIGRPQAFAKIKLLHQDEIVKTELNVARFNTFFRIIECTIRNEVFESGDLND